MSQHIFLIREDLNRSNLDGAKYICSPPLRDVATQEAFWRYIAGGTFNVVSSDHARIDLMKVKFTNGRDVDFRGFANVIPDRNAASINVLKVCKRQNLIKSVCHHHQLTLRDFTVCRRLGHFHRCRC